MLTAREWAKLHGEEKFTAREWAKMQARENQVRIDGLKAGATTTWQQNKQLVEEVQNARANVEDKFNLTNKIENSDSTQNSDLL